MKKIFSALAAFILLSSFTMDKPAYRLFTGSGKVIDYGKMLKELAAADVVFFGEQHNDPIAHWLQLELAKDLYQQHGRQLVLGTEMWEADTQAAVDSFLLGLVDEPSFTQTSRAWPNFATDYKPVLLFAKEKGLQVIATNAPRRTARIVAKESLQGLDALPPSEKQWLPLLPITVDLELPAYKRMLSMFGSDTHGASAAGSTKIVEAQALKDATMAHFISKNLKTGQHLLHLNGAYHSDHHEGILWYLKRLRPELKIKTVTTVLQPQLEKLEKEHLQRADVVLAVLETMTRTY
ncbi:ChaN family lipoprotein [Rufibacter quisquiliarum]|uniref:Putative iron-regulated protein n=1 Tax=Rufibacter quisquiliarum TaxID=1549639 RepID=A0A839GBQ5_9BACT|nr:ChaN family lipoprotein [Rufibacter quisquiliarum]MBA9077004.1 putative iron-regulated protein [Rufibacter quisquiliarum]